MPNYWLGIMAVAFAGALTVWIMLVFRADRKSSDRPQAPVPPREVIGGSFEARRGGRQVMPDPFEPLVHDDDSGQAAERSDSGQATPKAAREITDLNVPEQREGSVPEQAPARRDV
jgi:hypothetical protein